MHRSTNQAFFPGTVLCVFLYCGSAAAAVGSLAPHDVAGPQQWLADQRTACRALDPDYMTGDAISWSGACVAGMANGAGTLIYVNDGRVIETISASFNEGTIMPGRASAVWSNGDRYDGGQSAGLFDGFGKFAATKGDKIEGQWKGGAPNGKASVSWANGDRYDGNWTNGKADGEGTEVWADGARYEGLWRDGKPLGNEGMQNPPGEGAGPDTAIGIGTTPRVAARSGPPAEAPAAPQNTQRSALQGGGISYPLHDLLDQNLASVDGSTLSLNSSEGELTRTITTSAGREEKLAFAFMTDRIGTVSDDSNAIGVFRAGSEEVDTDYANGDTETMKRNVGGGLLIALHTSDGVSTCTAWYPGEHVFTQEEKRIAVQEYARRLGIADGAPPKKRRMPQPADARCGGSFLSGPANADAVHSPSSSPKADSRVAAAHTAMPSDGSLAAPVTAAARLQDIPVRDAPIHMIDAPFSPAAHPASIENVKFAPETTALSPADPAPVSDGQNAIAPTNAAHCLSVGSDGHYWGFRNRCSQAVQFAYCEMSNVNPLTSCNRTSVSGSVTANGFSPLVSDRSLSEQNVDHEFRWMACAGGAGEVIARLDNAEPPAGRCMRAVPRSQGD